jgi:hypothetical protein
MGHHGHGYRCSYRQIDASQRIAANKRDAAEFFSLNRIHCALAFLHFNLADGRPLRVLAVVALTICENLVSFNIGNIGIS